MDVLNQKSRQVKPLERKQVVSKQAGYVRGTVERFEPLLNPGICCLISTCRTATGTEKSSLYVVTVSDRAP